MTPLLAVATAAAGTSPAWALMLAAARTVPLIWLVPALGGWRLSPGMRLMLGVTLALLCVPMVARGLGADLDPAALLRGGPAAASSGAAWSAASASASASSSSLVAGVRLLDVLRFAREVAVGLSIGIAAGALFRAAELAGFLSGIVALSSGLPAAGPGGDLAGGGTGTGSGIGELYLLLGIVGFLELGGLTMLAGALVRSYALIPVGARGPGDPMASLGGATMQARGLAELVVTTTARIFETATVLAAPAIVAGALVTLASAIVARTVPRLGPALVSPPLRAWLGLAVVTLGLGIFEVTGAEGWRGAMSRLWALVPTALDLWRTRL